MSEQPYPARYVAAAESDKHGFRWWWTVTDTRTGEIVKRAVSSRESWALHDGEKYARKLNQGAAALEGRRP